MTREEFEDQVEIALDSLPEEIAALMDNIEVVVERRPTRQQLHSVHVGRGGLLLGLYVGVPLDKRTHQYGNVLPDHVVIFQEPIEQVYQPGEVIEGIRSTVLHEVGHHFGLSDDRLRQLGY